MVEIIAPFKKLDRRWPNVPCALPLRFNDHTLYEIRFERLAQPSVGGRHSAMRIFRSFDNGRSWDEIKTSLSFLDRIKFVGVWPPDPIDLISFSASNETLELTISDLQANQFSSGNFYWIFSFSFSHNRWQFIKKKETEYEG